MNEQDSCAKKTDTIRYMIGTGLQVIMSLQN